MKFPLYEMKRLLYFIFQILYEMKRLLYFIFQILDFSWLFHFIHRNLGQMWTDLPHISVYKMDNLLLFLYFVFQTLDYFHNWSILYISYGSRTSTRQGRGNTMGFTPGQNNGGNTTGNQTGGNNEKMRNITFILGYMNYMLFYGLCGLFVVIIHNLIYIYVFHNHFSNIQWFIFKTSIAERNFHLINKSPNFRKCSN